MKKSNFPSSRSFALEPEAGDGSPSALWPYVDNGTDIFTTERYHDAEFARIEWTEMWR